MDKSFWTHSKAGAEDPERKGEWENTIHPILYLLKCFFFLYIILSSKGRVVKNPYLLYFHNNFLIFWYFHIKLGDNSIIYQETWYNISKPGLNSIWRNIDFTGWDFNAKPASLLINGGKSRENLIPQIIYFYLFRTSVR